MSDPTESAPIACHPDPVGARLTLLAELTRAAGSVTAVVFQRGPARVFVNGEPADISDAALEAIEERAREASLVHRQRTTATTTADIVMGYADIAADRLAPMAEPPRPPNRAERRARRFGR